GEALLGVAASLEAQGKIDAAVAGYKEITSRHSGDSVAPDAKFALARLYEVQNKPELARDLYLEVEQGNRFSSKAIEAGMRIEDLITRYPKLAPQNQAPLTPAPIMLTNLPPQPPTSTTVGATNITVTATNK